MNYINIDYLQVIYMMIDIYYIKINKISVILFIMISNP